MRQSHAGSLEVPHVIWLRVGWGEAAEAGDFSSVASKPPPTTLRINLRSGVSENLIMQPFKKLSIFLVLSVNSLDAVHHSPSVVGLVRLSDALIGGLGRSQSMV